MEITEQRIRTADAVPKKLSHIVDGMIVFVLTMQQLDKGGEQSFADIYTYSSIIIMLQLLVYLASYQNNGKLGYVMYGSKARVMDGILGRENEIFGWICDKYMLPITAMLEALLNGQIEEERMVLVSYFVFIPIIVGDSFGELVGSAWGKQKIRVWGMGERNTKSIEGTLAVFVSSLVTLWSVAAYELSGRFQDTFGWYLLAVVVSGVSTFVELYAPRSTDNVFMVIANLGCCILYGTVTA